MADANPDSALHHSAKSAQMFEISRAEPAICPQLLDARVGKECETEQRALVNKCPEKQLAVSFAKTSAA